MKLICLLFALLVSAPLTATEPPDVGNRIGMTIVADGVLSIHERGFILHYEDGSTLTSAMSTPRPVLKASWKHDTGAGVITVEVIYEFPVPNPTEAQRRIYHGRFKENVMLQLSLFPSNVP